MATLDTLPSETLEHIFEECAEIRYERVKERERIKGIQSEDGCDLERPPKLVHELAMGMQTNASHRFRRRSTPEYAAWRDASNLAMVNRATRRALYPSIREILSLYQEETGDDEWVYASKNLTFGSHVRQLRLHCKDFSETRQIASIENLSLCDNIQELFIASDICGEGARRLDVDSPFIKMVGDVLKKNNTLISIRLAISITYSALQQLLKAIASNPPVCECVLVLDIHGSDNRNSFTPLPMHNLKTLVCVLLESGKRSFERTFLRSWEAPNIKLLGMGGFNLAEEFPDYLKPSTLTVSGWLSGSKFTFSLPFRSVTHLAVEFWMLPLIDPVTISSVHILDVQGALTRWSFADRDREEWLILVFLDIARALEASDYFEELQQRFKSKRTTPFPFQLDLRMLRWNDPPSILCLFALLWRILVSGHQHSENPLSIHVAGRIREAKSVGWRGVTEMQLWILVDSIKDLINDRRGPRRVVVVEKLVGRAKSLN